MTTAIDKFFRCGARPVVTAKAGAVPGPLPRRGPPSATGGPSHRPCGVRGSGSRATGQTKTDKNPLTIMHWNAEGIKTRNDGYSKKLELENILSEKKVGICCLQETHLSADQPFKVRGYQCFRSDRIGRKKGGILTLVKNTMTALETKVHMDGAEYQTLHIKTDNLEFDLLNYYCPNTLPLNMRSIEVTNAFLACGDFNSHSQSWGYDHMDARGEEVESWQDENNLLLINQASDPPTFYSRSWHTTSTPDLAFCTTGINSTITREVGDQLGGSDHRPVFLTLHGATVNESSPLPRWNYKKAKWAVFKHRTSVLAKEIKTENRDINAVVRDFNQCILKAAKEAIPRGARRQYKPYWTSHLQNLQGELERTRKEVERNATQANHNKYQAAKARFQKGKLEAQRESWKEKTESLNFEKDGKKLWRLTKQLNDEENRGNSAIAFEMNGAIVSGKQAADHLAQEFAKISSIRITADQQKALREEKPEEVDDQTPEVMTVPITESELGRAISKLGKRKSPGNDGITNEMLQHLGACAERKLLQIFNISWQTGQVPQEWKKATMIPLLKTGKDRKKASSYRPISLTSCVCKTLESIINHRMKWYLETEGILVPQQAGFRQCYSTEDQATYLSQVIEDAFQDKQHVLTAWIDLEKAFDKVWKEGLLVKLQQSGIQGKMFRWVKSYLHNRRARVRVNQQTSREVLMRHGVPQGGVLSPTLFLVFINDLIRELRGGTKTALYADDLAMWCKDDSVVVATKRMQQALNKLSTWAEKWCVTINKEKSSTTLFTLSTQRADDVKLGDFTLKTDDQPTYLGVTFDKRLTWKHHIVKAETKARRKLAIMRKISGTTWGANERILKTVYSQGIRPHLEYGSAAWSSAANTNLQALDKVQNQALRVMTGAMKSTPIAQMEKTTNIQPLKERRETKILQQAEKYMCSVNNPMKERMEDLARGRLQRSSFVHQAKRLRRQHAQEIPENLQPLSHIPEVTPWRDTNIRVKVKTTIPGVYSRDQQSNVEKRVATMATIEESYPASSWIRVYTDGSAENATKNGGAGIYIEYPDSTRKSSSISTGTFCSNYSAEIQAIMEATKVLAGSSMENQQVVILTDALSVLIAFENGKIPDLRSALRSIAHNTIVLQWIPSHCGIGGNEKADTLAKEGAGKEQANTPVTYSEVKTIIKNVRKPPTQPRDDYHLLNRQEQAIIFRLRTGHNRLKHHMFSKFKIGNSSACTCQNGNQTAEHVLQECEQLKELRLKHWPRNQDLQTKLHGPVDELRKTVGYILDSGLML